MSLKNIYNPLLKYGIQRVTDDSEWVVPADALVIDKLSQDYIADASTPENIKINDITANNIKFMLPSSLAADKYINIYIDDASTYGLIVNDGTQDYSIPKDTHIECYYSMGLDSWSVIYELPKPQTLVCSFADYKAIAAQKGGDSVGGYWYRVGRLKATYPSFANHVLCFKIFSEQAFDHSKYCVYAEMFYNYNTDGGVFYCTTCESSVKRNGVVVNDWFKPEHVVVVTTGTRTGADYASDVWVKLPNDTAVFFGIEIYGGAGVNKWSWAVNSWNGTQEHMETQPTGNVHVCEDKTEANIPADVLRAETQEFPMDILLEVLSSQNIRLNVQSSQTTDLQTEMMLDDGEAKLQARRIRRLVRDDYVLATEDGEAEFNVESGGYINVNATELFNILAKDMQFNGRTVPTLLRSFADGDTIVAEDSAHFYASDSISSLTVTGVYNPLQPNWHVTFAISFVTAASGAVSVTFPAEYKFTSVPVFGNNERWEIAMRDNYVVWTKYDL